MKNLNQIFTAVVLTFALTLPTLSNAGIGHQSPLLINNPPVDNFGVVASIVSSDHRLFTDSYNPSSYSTIVAQVDKKYYNQTKSSKRLGGMLVAQSNARAGRKSSHNCFQGNWRECLMKPYIPKGDYVSVAILFAV